ncbi:hypothetical protein H6G91_35315 [Nostoc muscorum FACHB-395]|nr:hypothetical protein [Desmonostoc muscorum FACHB-395]
MSIKLPEKIIVLWIVFLLGLLFHTQLGLMPLFHDLSVADSHAKSMAEIAPVMWLMLGFFVLPMIAIVATLLIDSSRYRRFHFGFSVIYSILNFAHLVSELTVKPIIWYQVVLVGILFVLGLFITRISWEWMQQKTVHQKTVHLLYRG